MSDRDRVLAFLTALIAVFVLTYAAGALVSPRGSDTERHHSSERREPPAQR